MTSNSLLLLLVVLLILPQTESRHLRVRIKEALDNFDGLKDDSHNLENILKEMLRVNIEDGKRNSDGETRSRLVASGAHTEERNKLGKLSQVLLQAQSIADQTKDLLKTTKDLVHQMNSIVAEADMSPDPQDSSSGDFSVSANGIVLKAEDVPLTRMAPIAPFNGQGLPYLPRQKRSASNQKIDDILQRAMQSPGLDGDVVFSARRLAQMYFGFDFSELTQHGDFTGQLYLYKKSRKAKAKDQKPGRSNDVRVSVYQIMDPKANQHASLRLLESRLVSAFGKGWVLFDVTKAVKDWSRNAKSNFGLEIWIESAQPSKRSVRLARKTKFILPNKGKLHKQPQLVISFPRDKN